MKVARKQNAWNVCRIAARFCLLYEDELFKKNPKSEWVSPSKCIDNKTNASMNPTIETNTSTTVGLSIISKEELRGTDVFSEEDDIVRIFAEINFIYAEVRFFVFVIFSC